MRLKSKISRTHVYKSRIVRCKDQGTEILHFTRGNCYPRVTGKLLPLCMGKLLPFYHGKFLPLCHGEIVTLESRGNCYHCTIGKLLPLCHGEIVTLLSWEIVTLVSGGEIVTLGSRKLLPLSHAEIFTLVSRGYCYPCISNFLPLSLKLIVGVYRSVFYVYNT